jgi:nitrous oxidase accessory protein NosD
LTIPFAAFAAVLPAAAGFRTAHADTLFVPDGYATIQAAIDDAVEGDTICISAGVYEERVIVNKSGILLVGEDGAIIRNTQPAFLPPIVLISPRVTGNVYFPKPDSFVSRSELRNLRIESAAANSVGVFGAIDCRVTGVTIVTMGNTGIGLHSWNEGIEVDHCTIIQARGTGVNGIATSPYGFHSDPAQHGFNRDVSLHHNDVTGFLHGILLNDCVGVNVGHNFVCESGYGLRVLGVDGGVIHQNEFNGSTHFGISIQNGLDLLIHHNTSLGSKVGFSIAADTQTPIAQYYSGSSGNTIMKNVFCDSIEENIRIDVPSDDDHDNYFFKNHCPP